MNKIDKFFKKELNAYQEEPPPHLWKSIESGLDKQEAGKLKKRAVWFLRVGLILVILSSALLIIEIYIHYQLKAVNNQSGNRAVANKQHKNKMVARSTPFGLRLDHEWNLSNIPSVTKEEKSKSYKKDIIASWQEWKPKTAYSEVDLSDMYYSKPSFDIRYDKFLPAISAKPYVAQLIPELGFAKKLNTRKSANSRFAIGAFFSPELSSNRMSEVYDFDNDDLDDYRKREKADLSYTVGVSINYKTGKNWAFQAGLLLSNNYTSIEPSTVKAKKDVSGNYSFKIASSLGLVKVPSASIANPVESDSIRLEKSSMQNLQYISLPVIVNYTLLSSRKTETYISAGVSANMITRAETEVTAPGALGGTEEMQVNKIEGLRKGFFSAVIGAGLNYKFTNHLSAIISPKFKFAFTPINKNTPVSSYPGTISIESGLLYRF